MKISGDNISRLLRQLAVRVIIGITVITSSLAYTTDRVVLVIIDGLRYSEGLGDPDHVNTPRMSGLAEQGALITDFQNDGYTYTSRAIPAIWCGAWTEINTFSDPACAGTINNTTELPTVFEYYRKQLDRPASDCVYTLKDLCSWKASFDDNYGPDYWPLYHTVGSTDTDVWHETEQVISDLAPHFLLMYLADVDHEGHSGNWENYLAAIQIADSLVGELWDVLQADSAYVGKTTMFVSNDHGRHDYDFSGHGDSCTGCRQIQLLAVGPDIQQGLLSNEPRSIPDIVPTIGELLGFSPEYATGTAMLELLDVTNAVGSKSINQTPGSIALTKVFPSPFNSEISIAFELGSSASGQIHIYNLSGDLVWSHTVSAIPGEPKAVRWSGIDQHKSPVPSGVYIVQLASGFDSVSQKVVLVK